MKVIFSIALLLTLALANTAAEAHAFGEAQICDSNSPVGVWRVNDTEGNTVLPGRQIALARTGEQFDSNGRQVTVFTVVGMGFGKLLEAKGLGFCHTNNEGHQEYLVVTYFSNKLGNHIAVMTPHSGPIVYTDEACANADASIQKNCEDYFKLLQTRLLAITTEKVSLDVTELQNHELLIAAALSTQVTEELEASEGGVGTEDIGNGHSHGGSG